LQRHGITAVLTGGACAAIYTGGRYLSADADFILRGPVRQSALDAAMASIGFRRENDRYIHPAVEFFVEFPVGPLAIGGDVDIHPVELGPRGKCVLALSATDSCRDRLAAYYHWDDRQSLDVAVQIALRNPVDWKVIEAWSVKEGAAERFAEFRKAVRRDRSRGGAS
jgi:hypothetical protein